MFARVCSGPTPTPCCFPESISSSQQAAHTGVFAQETLDYTGQKLNGSPGVESRNGPGHLLGFFRDFDAALPLPGAVQTMGNKVFQGTRHMGITLCGETYHQISTDIQLLQQHSRGREETQCYDGEEKTGSALTDCWQRTLCWR